MSNEPTRMADDEARMTYNRAYSKQRLKDIGLIGLGTALGGGLGWFAGDSLAQKAMSKPRLAAALRYGVPVASALTAGYVGHLDARRRELETERAHLAGLLAQRKARDTQPAQEKVAGNWSNFVEVVTDPEVWKNPFESAGVGALLASQLFSKSGRELSANFDRPGNIPGGVAGFMAPLATYTAGTGAAAYGGKKLYDRLRKKDQEPEKKANNGQEKTAEIVITRRPKEQPDPSKQLRSYPGTLLGMAAGGLLGAAGGVRAVKSLPEDHLLKGSIPLIGGGLLSLLGGHLGSKGDLQRLRQKAAEIKEAPPEPEVLARYRLSEPEDGGNYRVHKVARILASPAEWSETEKKTGLGVGAGALGGLAIGGLTSLKPTFAKFALPGAVIGGFIANRKAKRRQREQGYV